jgi:outer membrane protein assembly factor BamB
LFVLFSDVNAVNILNLKIQDEIIETYPAKDNNGLMESAWPMYCHDVRHTGISPYGKEGNYYVVKWKIYIGDILRSSPAIDEDGILYLGDFEYRLNAVYPNGTLKWYYETDGPVQSSPAIGDDGTIYVGSDDNRLYALNPNGTKKWKLKIGDGWVYSSPVIDENGIIFAGSTYGNNICAVYPNGTKKWDFKTGYKIYSSPALDNNVLYILSHDLYLYAIYKDNGTQKWRFKTKDWGGSTPTIDDNGIIYFGSNDNHLYAIYPNGTLKWRFSVGYDALTSSPALGIDGNIYFGCHAGYIYSLNSSNGKENWRYPTFSHYWDHEVSAPVAIDNNGIIYAGDWSGTLYALNPDGSARWKFYAGDAIYCSAVIGEDGTIYIASWDGYLYALEIIDIDNKPPLKPTVDGPTEGRPRREYKFTATTTDPDGDNVSYFFDWDYENDVSGWTDFVSNGESVSVKYLFYHEGTYNVKVRAQDEQGTDSEWTTFEVNIPRTKTTTYHWFLECFPVMKNFLFSL